MLANRPLNCPDFYVPKTLTRSYRIEGLLESGDWVNIFECADNHRRLNVVHVAGEFRGVRLVPLSTWGSPDFHIFSFDVQ